MTHGPENAFPRTARRVLVVGAFAVAGAIAPHARADEGPEVRATMSCDHVSEPGRVRCAVEARVAEGRTLAWADVTILEVPELASPLKARIGPSDATSRQPTSVTWAFAFVARRTGRGEARARVRAVTCEAPKAGDASSRPARCATVSTEVRTELVIGG